MVHAGGAQSDARHHHRLDGQGNDRRRRAGWFAKKVQSIPAGLFFGLAVGAALAFAACQMQPGPNKYYFEIMLPGSIVGAIVGWATQRYGAPARSAAAAMLAMFVVIALPARADESAADALAKLKSLQGKWTGHIMKPDGPAVTVEYRVTGGGEVVMETLFPSSPHEMVTMYSIDGDDLIATHYCSAQNQPTMKLSRAKSTAGNLVFDFVSVRGKHAHDVEHIHNGFIEIKSDHEIFASWGSAEPDGTLTAEPRRFFLTRAN